MEIYSTILVLCCAGGMFVWLAKGKGGTRWFPAAAPKRRKMHLLERVSLTHQHSIHLLAVEGRWLAVAVTPKGVDLLDSGPLAAPNTEMLLDQFASADRAAR
jgi:flagellar biogenesis protein FliO